MSPQRVACTQHGAVALIELGDGTRRNALGRADWQALAQLITSLAETPELHAIVLAGNHGTFSAGSDMNEWVNADLADVEDTFVSMEHCFQAIERAAVPVVAAVDGVAAGAGCQLALACDLILMSQSARIGMPIARLGILASPAFAARVSRRTGATVAADLYLTGRLMNAEEAERMGLVTRLVEDRTVRDTALSLATDIASRPPAAMAAAKKALAEVSPTLTDLESRHAAPTVAFADFQTAIRDFISVRRPA